MSDGGGGGDLLDIAAGEDARLASLYAYDILDTPAEAGFDDIVNLARAVCETPVALVSFVSFDRQWFKAKAGFPEGGTSLDRSVCAHVVAARTTLVFPDLRDDPRTRDNPLVTGPPHIRFYAGAPLLAPDGHALGSLCVIDDAPRPQGLTPLQLTALRVMADQVMTQLELRRLNAMTHKALLAETGASALREQFIAVLGHDLRNPLAAIASGVRILQRSPSKERADQVAGMMQASVHRMTGMIENVLDFARGRLGGGVALHLAPADLDATVRHVVQEARAAFPAATLVERLDLPRPISCDAPRLSQMLSNLLGNACTHGDRAQPVEVDAAVVQGVLEIAVVNSGPAIPDETMATLFKPFARGIDTAPRQGLGLGLYIASEIAKSHGGELRAASSDESTRFVFRMPVAA